VVENLRFFGGLYGVPSSELAGRIDWTIEMAGLRGHESDLVSALATGWKQRLALGCAVLHRPPILFLDEPTSGVDPIARRQFWDLIHWMAGQGVTVFVSTHYMDEAEYCHRLVLINRGQLVAQGTPTELKQFAVKGTMLLLECEPLGQAVEILGLAPQVLDAAVFGDALHVVVTDAKAAITGLPSYLAERAVSCSRIEVISPSLEDAFVQLTGQLSSKAAYQQ
jgi:ABC-2 type transport system ATP-binding protein